MGRKKKSSTIGIDGFTIFPYDEQSMTYGEAIPLTTIKSIGVSVEVAEHDEYNDNNLFEIITRFQNAEISCEFTDLTPREQGLILGWRRDGAVQYLSNNDVAKTFALAYKRTKNDGNSKYVKFLSCTARLDGMNAATESNSIEVQPDNIIFKAKPLSAYFPIEKYRGVVKLEVDTSDEEYNGEGDTWLSEALPADKPSTPAVIQKAPPTLEQAKEDTIQRGAEEAIEETEEDVIQEIYEAQWQDTEQPEEVIEQVTDEADEGVDN